MADKWRVNHEMAKTRLSDQLMDLQVKKMFDDYLSGKIDTDGYNQRLIDDMEVIINSNYNELQNAIDELRYEIANGI